MAIASVATQYVFSDFLLKDARETKYKGVRLELAVDKIVTLLAVGLPLFLISLAFAQEISGMTAKLNPGVHELEAEAQRACVISDEFPCDVRTGVLKNDSALPSAVQCKMVAVGVFRLLSYINLGVYLLLAPLVVLAALGPARQSSGFLRAYEILPGFGALGKVKPVYNDLSMYLLFLKENLSELKSFKCLQVLELLQQSADEGFDTMCLLQTLSQQSW